MADNTNTTETAATPEAKVSTVIDDMQSRMIFDDAEAAGNYLAKCQTDFADFNSYPFAGVGIDEDGFDPDIYNDSMQIAVAVLTQRGEGAGGSTVKAIVVYPSPKIEALMDSAAGKDWIAGLVAKEANHVAVRQLRKAEDADAIADAIQTMPTTLDAYTTSGRESTGGILQTYNDTWQLIKKAISAKSTPFRLANLSKKELRKAMESSAYALSVYPKLEDRHNKKGEPESLFVIAATYGQLLAAKKGLDSTVFDRALSQRDEKVIDAATDEDEDEFDFDTMLESMDAPADEATTDADGEANLPEAGDLPIG
jgi:hypothetical protein